VTSPQLAGGKRHRHMTRGTGRAVRTFDAFIERWNHAGKSVILR